MKDLSTKNVGLASLLFFVASAILYFGFNDSGNITFISICCLVLGVMLFFLAVANSFERPTALYQELNNIPTEGLNIAINRFPGYLAILFCLAFTGLVFLTSKRIDSVSYFLGVLTLIIAFGVFTRSYTLYNDRIEIFDLFSFPFFYPRVSFQNLISVTATGFSLWQATPFAFLKTGPLPGLLKLGKQGTSGTMLLKVPNRWAPVLLVNVYYPQNLATVINKAKAGNFAK
jgi:hypothetical protein